MDDQSHSKSESDSEMTRRKFLKGAAYVPPAVITVMASSGISRASHKQGHQNEADDFGMYTSHKAMNKGG